LVGYTNYTHTKHTTTSTAQQPPPWEEEAEEERVYSKIGVLCILEERRREKFNQWANLGGGTKRSQLGCRSPLPAL
jgi:hypothetical protein